MDQEGDGGCSVDCERGLVAEAGVEPDGVNGVLEAGDVYWG